MTKYPKYPNKNKIPNPLPIPPQREMAKVKNHGLEVKTIINYNRIITPKNRR